MSQGEIAKIRLEENTNLGEAFSKIGKQIDFHLSLNGDINSEVKYASSQDISYFGSASLSLVPDVGDLIFQKPTVEPTSPAFRYSEQSSTLSSNASSTVLGSMDISTKSGVQVNPLAPYFPSTTFSPNRSWIQVLFPVDFDSLLKISILELLQLALVKLLEKMMPPDYRVNEGTESKSIESIVVDNQQIQDQLIADSTI